MNSDGTETEAMWLLDGTPPTPAPTQTFSNLAGTALYIPSPFNDNKDGTYICSPSTANDPTRDIVVLNVGSKYTSIIYLFLFVCKCFNLSVLQR